MATSAGALTTVFTPAPSCTSDWYKSNLYYSIGGPSPSDCFPSGWASQYQYFSPGVCPDGYAQACSTVETVATVMETRGVCCPINWSCYTQTVFNFPGQACASVISSSSTRVVTLADNMSTTTVTFLPSQEMVNGYGVSIRYRAADSSLSTTLSSTSQPTSTSTIPGTTGSSTSTMPGTTVSSTSSSTASPTSQPIQSNGLSIGAKVGIGATAGILVLACFLAIIFVCFRRRSRRAPMEYHDYDPKTAQEMDGKGPTHEMEGKGTTQEIYTTPLLPAELDSGGGRRA